jgi:predicted nuclease of predicted toxin-antitoxin system
MKILFDQGTPVPLRQHLPGHTVDVAYERGWSNLSNGDLLDAAERDGYQVLITTDQNLRYQQNLADRQIAVVVLLSTHGHVFDCGLTMFELLLML